MAGRAAGHCILGCHFCRSPQSRGPVGVRGLSGGRCPSFETNPETNFYRLLVMRVAAQRMTIGRVKGSFPPGWASGVFLNHEAPGEGTGLSPWFCRKVTSVLGSASCALEGTIVSTPASFVSVRWNIPNALDEVFYLFRRETSRPEYPGNPPAYLVCPPWRWTAEGRAGNTASSQTAEVPPTGSATA